MAALKARYESELDHLRQEAESQLQRLLAEQQQQMRVRNEGEGEWRNHT
jgi:F0F1-type ATP synthase membrane subunit b/b'